MVQYTLYNKAQNTDDEKSNAHCVKYYAFINFPNKITHMNHKTCMSISHNQ
ncbi:MAG: hypothetical protein JWM44_3897 [Bacilli bacterium]|jgi:hypothetical protein|nr:hypothetical protein [Bacilli bacterium]